MWPKDVEPGLNFYRQVALRRHQVSSGSELMLWRLLARCAESADSPDFPDFPESAQGKDSSETRGPIALYTVDKSQANGTLGMSIAGGCVGRKGGSLCFFFFAASNHPLGTTQRKHGPRRCLCYRNTSQRRHRSHSGLPG